MGFRGDIRLGGKSFGSGSNTLGFTYIPDYGEMMINTDQQLFLTNSDNNHRGFRNTLMHEAMHALGIGHVASNDAAFLMEPLIKTFFDGTQLDDLLALQRLYGDQFEKGSGNDIPDHATPLGALGTSQSMLLGTFGNTTQIAGDSTDIISIDDDSDVDLFSFSLASSQTVTLHISPHGASYLAGSVGAAQVTANTLSSSNLAIAVLGSDGISILNWADLNPAGMGEEIVQQLAPGTYFARVTGDQNAIQLYQLEITATPPLAGDYNNNGSVDAADYIVWRRLLNQTGSNLPADGNLDGVIDAGDFDVWRTHFGQNTGVGSAANLDTLPSTNVPESASQIAILIAVLATAGRRR